MLQLLLLFVPIAFLLGWFWGKYDAAIERKLERERGNPSGSWSPQPNMQYFFSDSENTEQQLDYLMQLLDLVAAQQNTGELSLQLANCLRQRGEPNRAIALHLAIMQRTNDNGSILLQAQAKLELARDYITSGLLDRAAQLLKKLIRHKQLVQESLWTLFCLYDSQQSWQKALGAAKALRRWSHDQRTYQIIAYLWCQVAAVQLHLPKPVNYNHYNDTGSKNRNDNYNLTATTGNSPTPPFQATRALKYLQRALRYYPKSLCARYYLAEFYLTQKDYAQAWTQLTLLLKQDISWIALLLPAVRHCCRNLLRARQEWIKMITKQPLLHYCSLDRLELAWLLDSLGTEQTIELLLNNLTKTNLVSIVTTLLNIYLQLTSANNAQSADHNLKQRIMGRTVNQQDDTANLRYQLVKQLHANLINCTTSNASIHSTSTMNPDKNNNQIQIKYRCSHCQLISSGYFWCCPRCHYPETLQPYAAQ